MPAIPCDMAEEAAPYNHPRYHDGVENLALTRRKRPHYVRSAGLGCHTFQSRLQAFDPDLVLGLSFERNGNFGR
jgi:hypothetical protein